jgi:hypothetical protein
MLGDRLREARDVPAARACYQLAIDSGNESWAELARQRQSGLRRWRKT